MLWNRGQYFHCIVLLCLQIDHRFFFRLQVFTAIDILAKFVGALHVVKLAVTARISQDIEVIWIVNRYRGLRLLHVKHCLSTNRSSLSCRRLNIEEIHWILHLLVFVWVSGKITFEVVQFL